MTVRIINADVMDGLRQLPDESVHCVVTSPPYWGLRDYGVDGQIGLESTFGTYVTTMADVFDEVRRVLRSDGTLWLNLGDSYAGSWGAQSRGDFYPGTLEGASSEDVCLSARQIKAHPKDTQTGPLKRTPGLKSKDLIGIPWRVAFALQGRGWWLRSDIVWAKPNPMPESVTDRPTKAHEYVFLLTKSERYFYDAEAIREARTSDEDANGFRGGSYVGGEPGARAVIGNKRIKMDDSIDRRKVGFNQRWDDAEATGAVAAGRNKRTVWTVATQAFTEAHFATFPPDLIEPMIKAGCPKGGTVLDPFGGAGTTGLVADRLQRNAILIELNPEYAAMAEKRINGDRGGLLDMMEAAE
jgi:DNA modification methylase